MKIRFGRLFNYLKQRRIQRALDTTKAFEPWFAWYPVKIKEQDWRFLETVYRRNSLDPTVTCAQEGVICWSYQSKEDLNW